MVICADFFFFSVRVEMLSMCIHTQEVLKVERGQKLYDYIKVKYIS